MFFIVFFVRLQASDFGAQKIMLCDYCGFLGFMISPDTPTSAV
jgi:hypothetical protein